MRQPTSIRLLLLAACSLGLALSLSACGGAGGGASDDWYYHWDCNGDSECLATNPTGAPSGTVNEGPNESSCTELLTFAQHFWGPAATDSCDHDPNGSSSGGGGGTLSISGFSPTASAPCNSVTLTGSGFPTSVTGVTVTIDGLTATVNQVSSTSITFTLPCTMPNFSGPFTVTTSGSSATSAGSFTVVNHLLGVGTSGSQFIAVGRNGTLLGSSDGSTWAARTSNTTADLNAVAWSGSAFVVVGNNGTILRSTDGINWTSYAVPGNFQDHYAVAWSSTANLFVTTGKGTAIFTSPDGITWTLRSSPTSLSMFGVAAGSGTTFAAVGQSGNTLSSPDGSTWTQHTAGAANGNNVSGVAWNGSVFVAVGIAQTIMTSSNASTWTAQTDSTTGDVFGVAWNGTKFVAVGFNSSTVGSVILDSVNGTGTSWTSRDATPAGGRSLNAVTFGNSEFVAVGGYGTIVTSLDGVTWTHRAGD